MCGRFIQSSEPESYAGALGIAVAGAEAVRVGPRYNVAPTLPVMAITMDGPELRWSLLRWGLVPHWSRGPDPRYSMINARAESLSQRPAFRSAFLQRRCVVPADGFYEWRKEESGRQPYLVHRGDGLPLFLAALWDLWRGPEGALASCTIVVTDANAAVAPLHDRMPVALSRASVRDWLDSRTSLDTLESLLRPAPPELFAITPVSKRVNSPRNEGPDLVDPLAGR